MDTRLSCREIYDSIAISTSTLLASILNFTTLVKIDIYNESFFRVRTIFELDGLKFP